MELFLFDCHISKYTNQNQWVNDELTRTRKLLLKKREILSIEKEVSLNQGYSIVPLNIFFNDKNLCKITVALVQGKKNYDKRASEKAKELNKTIKQDIL